MDISPQYLTRLAWEKINSSDVNRADQDWYYFLHVPKTAGTSFRYLIYDHFAQSRIYPNYYNLLLQKNTYLGWTEFKKRESEIFPATKDFLIGHYGWAPMHQFSDHSPQVLSFVREPVRRIMSSIVFHQKRGRRYTDMTVDEVLDQYLEMEGSLQARQFGYAPQRDNLELAIERMNNIAFVGLSEQYDKSLALCNKTFGWSLKKGKKKNVGSGVRQEFTSEQIQRIEEGCQVDRQFYEAARIRFERECAAL